MSSKRINKSRLIFGMIAIVIILVILATTYAFVVQDGTTVTDLIRATQNDDFYTFDVSAAMSKRIGINAVLFEEGGYCVDPHTQIKVGDKYEIVNTFDINNATNTVKVYSVENKNGTEYSISDPKVKPLIMLSYLTMKANERPADMTMETGYKPVIWRIFQSRTWVNNLKEVGLSQSFQTAAYGDGVLAAQTTKEKLEEAERYADAMMAGQSTDGEAILDVAMTDEEKASVSVIVDGGKTYIGPYKLTLKNGCEVGEITINGTDTADGISTDLENVKEVDEVVDNTEFYVVLNKEIDRITSITVKAKETINTVKSRMILVGNSPSQNFMVWKTEERPIIPQVELEVPKFGSLQIEKVDEFENASLDLKDIGFVVWSESKKAFIKVDNGTISYVDFATAKANEFKTVKTGSNSNPEYKTETIEKLPLGKYTVYETSIPEALQNYYELPKTTIKDKGNKTVTDSIKLVAKVDISSGQTATVHAENGRDFTDFYIIKRDEESRELLNGMEFKLFKVSTDGLEKHWVVFDENYEVTGVEGTWDEASTLVTGITGEAGRTQTITRLPLGKYMIFETGVGNNDEYSIGSYRMNGATIPATLLETKEIKANETGVTYLEEKNKQVFINISGKVWEDTEADKNDDYKNGKLGEEDSRINGIEVKLINRETGNTVATTKTAYDDKTEENGVYRFKRVKIADLGKLYIEFTYDGVTYQSVATTGTADNESKASETSSRSEVNNKFKELTGEGQKFESGETLTYTKTVEEDNIEVKSNNIGDRSLDEDNKLVTMTKQGDFTVNSTTADDYLASAYQQAKTDNPNEKVKEIENVNLGVYVRTNPLISITKNIENAQVSINGKKYTYKYATKDQTRVSLGVQFENLINKMYSLPLYRADVAADLDESKELKVFVTYKISLINDRDTLYAKINSLKDIYSSDMEFVKIYKLNEDGTEKVIYDQAQETTQGDYKTTKFDNLDIKVNPNTAEEIYVTYRLPKDKFTDAEKRTLYEDKVYRAYSEIASYSVYSDEFNSLFASFDNNSIPSNFDVTKAEETFEDDTGVAGGLKLVDAGERKTTGVVFEDSDTDANDNQRIGDGKYSDDENKVAKVKVNFIDVNTNEVVATATTNEEGTYEISGFIPGDYKLEFVWGEGENTTINGKTVKLDRYKSTIWTEDNLAEKAKTDWYKSQDPRYSDALDNYDIRVEIDAKTKDLRETLENDDNTAKMKSETQNIDVGIELEEYDEILEGENKHYEFNINNIDFGIIERPIQSMEIDKTVDSVRINLADDNTFADAKINENGELEGITKNVTGGPNLGFVKVELNSNLISGAKARIGYKITVKNTSEKDYDSKEYYLYGKEDESKLITQTAEGVYDYLSGINPDTNSNTDWDVIPANEVLSTVKTTVVDRIAEAFSASSTSVTTDEETKTTKWILEEISETTEKQIEKWTEEMLVKGVTYKDVKYSDKIISKNKLSDIKLGAGEEKEFTFYSDRILAPSDEISFENDAEITNVIRNSNTGSRVSLEHSKLYNKAELVSVTPETGEDKNYTPIIIIAISSIAVLGVGILVIKKVVLKK